MDHRLTSYLRTLRRRVGFTQQEIAFLIGVKSRTVISRIERAKRVPSLGAVFIYAIVFDVSPIEMLPGLMSEFHEALLQRAAELYDELEGDGSKTTRAKLDFLEQLLERSQSSRNDSIV